MEELEKVPNFDREFEVFMILKPWIFRGWNKLMMGWVICLMHSINVHMEIADRICEGWGDEWKFAINVALNIELLTK